MFTTGVYVLATALVVGASGGAPTRRTAGPDGRIHINQSTFDVPYSLSNAPAPAAFVKPALFSSTDGGRRWTLAAVDADGRSPVTFRAPGDGEYWLRMGFHRLGDAERPESASEAAQAADRPAAPSLVVVVDTRPPVVRLRPRLVGPAPAAPGCVRLALAVAVEADPAESPDASIEVEWSPLADAPAARQMWVPRAAVGREYEWLIEPRRGAPTVFHAVAVDQAGNIGRDTLSLAHLARDEAFRSLAEPEVTRLRALRTVAGRPDASGRLAAEIEYTVDGPPLAPDEQVELWATADDGRTWSLAARHRDRSAPLLFVTDRPGLHGLRLVLRRGEAYVGDPPSSGTKPQAYAVMERAADETQIVRVRPAAGSETGAEVGINRHAAIAPQAAETAVAAAPARPPEVADAADLARQAYERGNFARLLGRWDEAAQFFQEAIRREPDGFEALNDLAGCLYHQGRFADAAEVYRRALRTNAAAGDTRFNLARTLVRLNRREEALDEVDEALRLNPTDGEAWFLRGELLLAKGDARSAAAAWQRAVREAPAHAEWAALARQRLAQFGR